MGFVTEINAAIKSGVQKFKHIVEQKLSENDLSYLEHPFWMEDGSQITVLNYLIQQHQEKKKDSVDDELPEDLTDYIDFILSKVKDKNIGEPLHYAIAAGKVKLALHLLENNAFDMNRRDEEGRTLLSLSLTTKNSKLLNKILNNQPDVNAITRITDTRIPFQPLHQAILLDFAIGVSHLAKTGADLANPMGTMRDTPVLLAARQGKIKALEALLEFPVEKLNIEAENTNLSSYKKSGDNAIELLCKRLARDPNNKDVMRGVAMLLCHGAEAPRNKVLCQLLADNRKGLLKEIDHYLDSRPMLVDSFVNRCHLTDSALYKIIYVDHSWGNTLRQLFGRPSNAAFVIEKLVTRKYSRRTEGTSDNSVLPTAAAQPLKREEPALKLYAEFVRRYSETYENQRITNPWSSMRWMIAEGKCNWDTVEQYARTHPGSRTQIIYDDMFKTLPKMEMHIPSEVTLNNLSK